MTFAYDPIDWQVRAFAYRVIAARGTPPAPRQIGAAFGVTEHDVRAILDRLHRAHALFLDPSAGTIRMAHPFSAVPTAFRVRSNGRSYWANCAWDALGIPAALHSDASVEARCAATGQHAVIEVRDGQVRGNGEIAHFPLPFRMWYDDLITT